MPETTPMPKDTAKIFSQKKYRSRQKASLVRSQRHSMKASQLARPMVKAGNRMWNEMTNPNWIRESNSASTKLLRGGGNAAGGLSHANPDGYRSGTADGADARPALRVFACRGSEIFRLVTPAQAGIYGRCCW